MATQTHKSKNVIRKQPSTNRLSPSNQTREQFALRRPERVHLSSEETRARMESFPTEREEAFVATIRKD